MAVETCPLCHVRLPAEFLKTHLLRAHGTSEVALPTPASPPPTSAYQADLATGLAPAEPPAPVPSRETPVEAEPTPAPEEPATAEPAPESSPAETPEAQPTPEPALPVETAAPMAEASPTLASAPELSGEPMPAIPSAAEASPPLTTLKDLRHWAQRRRQQTAHHLEQAEAWVAELEGPRHKKTAHPTPASRTSKKH